MNVNQAFPSRYLKPADLAGGGSDRPGGARMLPAPLQVVRIVAELDKGPLAHLDGHVVAAPDVVGVGQEAIADVVLIEDCGKIFTKSNVFWAGLQQFRKKLL